MLLGRDELFIRRNSEIELKMPNHADRWNNLVWHSLWEEFFFSLTSLYMQTGKQTNTISEFHKKRVRSQKYHNHRKTVWIWKHIGGPSLQERPQFLPDMLPWTVSSDPVSRRKVEVALQTTMSKDQIHREFPVLPARLHTYQPFRRNTQGYLQKIYRHCFFRNPKSCRVVLD